MIFSHKNFSIRLIIFFVLSATFIVFAGTYRNLYYMSKYVEEEFIQKVTLAADEKKLFFNNLITNLKNSTKAIARDRLLASAINKDNFLKPKAVLETLMNANKDFMQIRYLDKDGNELIRIQRDEVAKSSYFINNLQNKSNRYYFKSNNSLKDGEIWFSDIDLNMEHGKIETPIKPVLRSVCAVYIKKKFKGLVIINYFMEDFLKQLTASSLFHIYLIDDKGDFLIHRDIKHSWSKYFNHSYKIKDLFPSDYKNIYNGKLSIKPNNKIFVMDLTIGHKQNLKMIFIKNEEALNKNILASKRLAFFIGLFGILLSIPIGYLFSRPFNKMHEELEKLNHTLENRVKEAIEENRQNEQILMQQSKLAAMGEMIGNIAHQWRQPLTRLSLIIQNISIAHELGKLNTTFIKKSEKNAIKQIDYMSNTIDDFREFFTPSRDKEVFGVANVIKEALNLQSASIKHNNIELKLKFDYSIETFGHKNEFAQVILNLINNSKDAFIEENIVHRELSISVKYNQNKIEINVADNAKGIKDEQINKIFDPYFTTKFSTMGTGIGLYMSKIIIEKHMQGTIVVQNINEGASFIIRLPGLN